MHLAPEGYVSNRFGVGFETVSNFCRQRLVVFNQNFGTKILR